jgi:hypothetical protein
MFPNVVNTWRILFAFAAVCSDAFAGDLTGSFLDNPDFSTGAAAPDAWSEPENGVTAARDASVYKTAPSSMRLDGTSAQASGWAFQMMKTVEPRSFIAGGWYKSSGSALKTARILIQALNADWGQVDRLLLVPDARAADWTRFSVRVSLPPAAVHAGMAVLVEGEGTLWVDAFEISTVTAGEPDTLTATGAVLSTPHPLYRCHRPGRFRQGIPGGPGRQHNTHQRQHTRHRVHR